ncbi:hypothetical protein C8R45DRAFT_937518 [Mycena sanguinolenta]|nr:hypothetical protein C8R45DRAFT_937518 [Mycena sanguinolenta]
MPFAALGDDILLNILAVCDVHRVLTVSAVRLLRFLIESLSLNRQIDKRLRGLTHAKQLWLSLIQDSAFRHVLELRPPDGEELERLSTGELVDLVKRAVIGPPQWWPGGPSSSRTSPYTITCDTGLDRFWGSCLLHGARYIVLGGYSTDLYMFDVWSGRRVWTFAKKNNHAYYAIDLVPGGITARVILAVVAGYVGSGYHIHVEDIDLTTGASHEVFRLDSAIKLNSISAIVGDFFLYSPGSPVTPNADVKQVLVNWRLSTYVVLNYGKQANSAAPQEYHGLPLGDSTHTYVKLSITPSAVYEGAYTIVTHTTEFPKPPTFTAQVGALFTGKRLADSRRAVQLAYSLRPPPTSGQACALRLVSAQLATPRGRDGSGARVPPRALVAHKFTSSVVQIQGQTLIWNLTEQLWSLKYNSASWPTLNWGLLLGCNLVDRPWITSVYLGLPRSTSDFSWSTPVHVGVPHEVHRGWSTLADLGLPLSTSWVYLGFSGYTDLGFTYNFNFHVVVLRKRHVRLNVNKMHLASLRQQVRPA